MSASNGNGTRPERFAAVESLELEWAEGARWDGIKRDYTAEDVIRLRGSLPIEHTLARHGAEKLWRLLAEEDTSRRSARSPAARRCRWPRPA